MSPQKLCIHEEFPIGSIVGINGYHLDYGKFKVKKHAPLFYGLVEDPSLHQSKEELNEDEVVVKFVVTGEYEWYDRNKPNCLISNYLKKYLVLCHPPPVNVNGVDFFAIDDDSVRWFSKGGGGWAVKVFEDPCYGCGSP